MIDPLLLTTLRVNTFNGGAALTGASGFLFKRDGRLYLVSSRHVFWDEASNHAPDRVEIEVHVDPSDLGKSTGFSIPLYSNGQSIWRAAEDAHGEVDVALIEIQLDAFPSEAVYHAFEPGDIQQASDSVPIGTRLIAVGYPLAFQDKLHHLPVARQASLASSWGLRFNGKGYFLVDARTHRGISGAPVVMRQERHGMNRGQDWKLLGIHSARLESQTRDPILDETLGLNSVWYADVLMALTGPAG